MKIVQIITFGRLTSTQGLKNHVTLHAVETHYNEFQGTERFICYNGHS